MKFPILPKVFSSCCTPYFPLSWCSDVRKIAHVPFDNHATPLPLPHTHMRYAFRWCLHRWNRQGSVSFRTLPTISSKDLRMWSPASLPTTCRSHRVSPVSVQRVVLRVLVPWDAVQDIVVHPHCAPTKRPSHPKMRYTPVLPTMHMLVEITPPPRRAWLWLGAWPVQASPTHMQANRHHRMRTRGTTRRTGVPWRVGATTGMVVCRGTWALRAPQKRWHTRCSVPKRPTLCSSVVKPLVQTYCPL